MLNIIGLAVAFTIGQPEPERELRNYAAELNAPILAIPVEERAWTVYKRAILALEPAPEWFESGWPDAPTQAQIDEATAYLDRNREAINLVREAASMPHLGYILQDATEPEFERALAAKQGREPIIETPNENPLVQDVLLINLATILELSNTLIVDCRIASLTGDARRLEIDLDALLGLSIHAGQTPFPISDLVSFSRASYVFQEIQWALAKHSGIFSDAQILSLRDSVHSHWPAKRLRAGIESITYDIDQYHDRSFDEDGLITVEGIGLLQSVSGADEVDDEANERMFWFWGSLLLREPEMRRMVQQQVELIETYIQTPLWEHDNPTCNDKSQELLGAEPLRYGFVAVMIPSGDDIARSGEVVTQLRDATLVSIALELYHREHGAFPESLDELVPAFLEEIPLDRFDGKPLKYHLTPEGPVLYSVGTDRDDDGGVAPEFGNALEWFTPTEVEAARRGDPEAPTIPDGDWILFPPGG